MPREQIEGGGKKEGKKEEGEKLASKDSKP
jgi:hypothetical protein